MTRRQRRMAMVAAIVIGVGALFAVASQVFQKNLMYFYSASELSAGAAPAGARVRFGGLVVPGSVQREAGSLDVHFTMADCDNAIPVQFHGILPDLFREGQGIVASGKLTDGLFIADEVLAKHDENYMPPELAEALGGESGKHSCAPFKSLEKSLNNNGENPDEAI